VTVVWNNGTMVSCTTNASGRCSVSRSNIQPNQSATVTVTNVTHAVFLYQPSINHDPDRDSDGTAISVSRQ
jgi:hypothetical protein